MKRSEEVHKDTRWLLAKRERVLGSLTRRIKVCSVDWNCADAMKYLVEVVVVVFAA
uniref:Uncharacterized protein n=1 Tax=Salix viminalis TaxID=40686 RepID=A0A6N2K1H9_SALVM